MAYGPHDELRRQLYERKISVTEAANVVGISRNRLSYMLNGKTKMTERIIVGLRALVGNASQSTPMYVRSQLLSLAGTPLSQAPLVGSIPADTSYRIDPEAKTVYIPSTLAQSGNLNFIAPDDAMMPVIQQGTLGVFVERPSLRKGRIYLIESAEGELRIRMLVWREGRWMAAAPNPNYPAEPVEPPEVKAMLIGSYAVAGTHEAIEADPSGLTYDEGPLQAWG